MRHKITLPQLKKYDVTQKVIESLADAESRAIVFSIVHTGFIGFVLLNLFRPADGDAKERAQAVVSLAILMGFFCA